LLESDAQVRNELANTDARLRRKRALDVESAGDLANRTIDERQTPTPSRLLRLNASQRPLAKLESGRVVGHRKERRIGIEQTEAKILAPSRDGRRTNELTELLHIGRLTNIELGYRRRLRAEPLHEAFHPKAGIALDASAIAVRL